MKIIALSLLSAVAMEVNAEISDSLINAQLDEISIVSSIKENGLMRQQPASSMINSNATLEAHQGKSLKTL